jgi:Mor family transcriptional regulator
MADEFKGGNVRDYQRQYRLSKKLWHYQMVRLDHDDARMLRILTEREGSTVSELIRRFVTWGLEEYDIQEDNHG